MIIIPIALWDFLLRCLFSEGCKYPMAGFFPFFFFVSFFGGDYCIGRPARPSCVLSCKTGKLFRYQIFHFDILIISEQEEKNNNIRTSFKIHYHFKSPRDHSSRPIETFSKTTSAIASRPGPTGCYDRDVCTGKAIGVWIVNNNRAISNISAHTLLQCDVIVGICRSVCSWKHNMLSKVMRDSWVWFLRLVLGIPPCFPERSPTSQDSGRFGSHGIA